MPLFWPFKKESKRVFASIDLGSNAVRLQIIKYKKDGEYYSLDKLRRPLRLGLDVFQTGVISQYTIDKAVETFLEFNELIQTYGVAKVRAVGTSALREATNQDEFVQKIKQTSGIEIEVISGLEEARLITEAVEKVADTSSGNALLLDIGGGSLELTLLSWGHEEFRVSFPMGTLRTMEKLKTFSVQEVTEHYQQMLLPLQSHAKRVGPIAQFLGTGGNVGRFASLIGEIIPASKNSRELGLIERKKLQKLGQQFYQLGVEGIVKEFGLSRDRADVAFPASLVLDIVMEVFGIKEMRVPFVELSDGVIYTLIDEYHQAKKNKARLKVSHNMAQVSAGFKAIEAKMDQSFLKQFVYEVADFPTPGIMFKDVTPLFENPQAFERLSAPLAEALKLSEANKVIGIDARGFIVGAAISRLTQTGLVLARKPGKLPRKTIKVEYQLEYGTNSLEITEGSLRPGDKVFIVDDLLATGGTVEAAKKIAEKMGAVVVGIGFIIELGFLNGRKKLSDAPIVSLLKY